MQFLVVDKAIKETQHIMNAFHSHLHYELYILTKGDRQLFINNRLFRIHAPSMVLIPPHCLHRTEGGSYERYNINIMPQYLGDYEKTVLTQSENIVFAPNKKDYEFMIDIVEKLSNIENELPPPEAEYVAKSLFASFLFVYKKQIIGKQDAVQNPNNNISYITLKILDYFNENYDSKIVLDKVAEEFFISTSSIIYNFKRDLGCTPIDFLLKIRLNKAKEKLLFTKKTITDIAFECGFSSPVYFGNIFKTKEGLSPRDYRKFRQILR